MMIVKILTTFLLTCSSLIIYGQITITKDDMPTDGDTLRYSETQIGSIDISRLMETGVNYNWDFSDLSPVRQGIDEYQSSAFTPYALFFLGFNKYGVKIADDFGIPQIPISNVYSFFSINNNAFKADGLGMTLQGVPLPAYFSDDDEIYQFPLEYQDRDSSTLAFELIIPTIGNYTRIGHRINLVDGWGTINTPYGSFECIRVMSEITATDSIDVSGINLGLPYKERTYKWLAKGEKMPILEIMGNSGPAGNFIITRVRYRDHYREGFTTTDIADWSEVANVPVVSPNPSVDGHFVIQLDLLKKTDLQFSVYSIDGKLIEQVSLPNLAKGQQEHHLDLSDKVGNGMYFLNIENNESRYTTLLVVSQ